jgi:smad nuclear-interacting protein 1
MDKNNRSSFNKHHNKKPYDRHKQNNNNNNNKEDISKYEYGKKEIINSNNNDNDNDNKIVNKEKPSLELSGNLAKDTNTFNGIVIKYNEPPEARKPKKRWRLYVFKGNEELPFYQIHRQSAYLFGRERKVADIPVDHPSCSSQHAVLQFRLITIKNNNDNNNKLSLKVIKPYIIDLESTNGTYINNDRIESKRYYELKEKDVIKFGYSSREYILLHEESKQDNELNDIYNDDNDDDLITKEKD